MNYILFVSLIVLLIIIYCLNGKRILSVSFVTTAVFLLSSLTFTALSNYFSYQISYKTVLLILFDIIVLFVGEKIGLNIIVKSKSTLRTTPVVKSPYFYSKKTVLVMGFLSILLACLSYYNLFQRSLANGNPGDIFKAVAYTREETLASTNTSTPIYTYLNIVFQGYSFICLYMFLYNKLFCKKNNWLLLFPMIGTVLYQITTTERIGFIRIIGIFIVLYAVLKGSSNGWKSVNNKRIIIFASIGLVLFLAIFFALGIVSNRIDASLWSNSLGNYLGAPILGLDIYVQSPWTTSSVFGQRAFRDFYEIVNIFGANIDLGDPFLPFFSWGNSSSNVYTSIAVPLNDFGLIGFAFTRLAIGIAYGYVIKRIEKLKNMKASIVKVILFGLFMYPIFMSSIADSFSYFIQLPTIYLTVSIFAIWKIKTLSNKTIRYGKFYKA